MTYNLTFKSMGRNTRGKNANHSCSLKLPKVTVRALRVIPVQLLFSQEFIHESKTEKKGDTVVIRFTLKFTQRS